MGSAKSVKYLSAAVWSLPTGRCVPATVFAPHKTIATASQASRARTATRASNRSVSTGLSPTPPSVPATGSASRTTGACALLASLVLCAKTSASRPVTVFRTMTRVHVPETVCAFLTIPAPALQASVARYARRRTLHPASGSLPRPTGCAAASVCASDPTTVNAIPTTAISTAKTTIGNVSSKITPPPLYAPLTEHARHKTYVTATPASQAKDVAR